MKGSFYVQGVNNSMQLKVGDVINALTVHGKMISGTVETIGENIVIVATDCQKEVIRKQELKKQGYTFPRYKKYGYSHELKPTVDGTKLK